MLIKSFKLLRGCFATLPVMLHFAYAADLNQTPTVSPVLPGSKLPFTVEIKLSKQSLPVGFHSGAVATYGNKWLFIAGRTNGLHGFDSGGDPNANFPSQSQNKQVIVVDLSCGLSASRSLEDEGSGLSERQVDLLSVVSPQSYQLGNTLYMTGGYGVDRSTGTFGTKDALSAIDVPGLINWVIDPRSHETAKQHIRHIFDPIFQITGGFMGQMGDEPTLLVFGQNFDGSYDPSSNGDYSNQVRRFRILDDGHDLRIHKEASEPPVKDELFRRRDLNVVPSIRFNDGDFIPYLVALSGVFTKKGGAWTIPVVIDRCGHPSTFSPEEPKTFKQAMNNYACATVGLFSKSHNRMYTTLFGGITYGYFAGDTFNTDSELPFDNEVTTVRCNARGEFSQFLMDASFPEIKATGWNAGSTLLFGAGAEFIPKNNLSAFNNGVLDFDALAIGRTTIGYIVGGIQSTKPNTDTKKDSSASSYIFKVRLSKGI